MNFKKLFKYSFKKLIISGSIVVGISIVINKTVLPTQPDVANYSIGTLLMIPCYYMLASVVDWCQKNLIGLLLWFFFGELLGLAFFQVIFNSIIDMRHIGITSGAFLMGAGACIPPVITVLIYQKAPLFLDRVKFIVYINAAIFLVPTIITNVYTANVVNASSIPQIWHVTDADLAMFHVSAKDYLKLIINTISAPFLISNAVLRVVVEGIAYFDKWLKEVKEKMKIAGIASYNKPRVIWYGVFGK